MTPTDNLEAGAGDLVEPPKVFCAMLTTGVCDKTDRIAEAAAQLAAVTAENARLRHDNEMMTNAGIIEIAIRNPSVSDYMSHWEIRTERAEAQLKAAREMIDRFCQINCQDAQALADAQTAAMQEAPK